MTPGAGRAHQFLVIGQIVAPHGIRGEVRVEVMTDVPERFGSGAKVFLSDTPAGAEAVQVAIETSRPHQGRMLVKLAKVSDRSAAEQLRGHYLLIPEAEAAPLGEHENYVHDLIGLQVVTTADELLGNLVEVIFTSANDVYVVRGDAGEILVPALRSVVLAVDLNAHRMTVALPEGLTFA